MTIDVEDGIFTQYNNKHSDSSINLKALSVKRCKLNILLITILKVNSDNVRKRNFSPLLSSSTERQNAASLSVSISAGVDSEEEIPDRNMNIEEIAGNMTLTDDNE
uniref:Uncharacterized protein n=1 Tax=Glossina pallidipes TaxID=7398 RepID=A0A1A9ZXK1_GLOPL